MTHLPRRDFLRALSIATATFGGLALRSARAAEKSGSITMPSSDRTLVVLFQRGAADGLSLVPPIGDKAYATLRPTIGIAKAKRLDATFGLHPALGALTPLWDAGALAIVHAVGPADATRSHFDAQDYCESGTPGLKTTSDGFLARALAHAPEVRSPLRAVAMQPTLPRMLKGDPSAIAIGALNDLKVAGPGGGASAKGFEDLYEGAVDEAMRGAGADAFAAIASIATKKVATIEPKHGAVYPTSPLGKRLKQVAQLIRADVGLQMAATDCGGWDTHANQGADEGQLARRCADFGDSIAAFAKDLEDARDRVCLVTVTEFGRTAKENGTGGTDHGHGGVMMVVGGKGLHGKRVHGAWKGLAPDALYEGRDVAVTSDHRDVFAEVLRRHAGVKDLAEVFPGYTPKKIGVFG